MGKLYLLFHETLGSPMLTPFLVDLPEKGSIDFVVKCEH